MPSELLYLLNDLSFAFHLPSISFLVSAWKDENATTLQVLDIILLLKVLCGSVLCRYDD